MSNSLVIDGRKIKGVAFDLEGTVVDLEPQHWAAHVATAESLGISLSFKDPQTFTIVPHFIGGPHEQIMREILQLAIDRGLWQQTDEETREAKLASMDSYDRDMYRNLRDVLTDMPPREGFLEIFEQIRARGLPVAIGSLTETQDAKLILQKSGLDQLFDPQNIILKEDVSNVKPNPEVYLKTAQRLGIDPRRQLVFEDSHNGIIAAREAGSVPIGIPSIDRPEVIQRLRDAGAVQIFTGWREVNLGRLLNGESEHGHRSEAI